MTNMERFEMVVVVAKALEKVVLAKNYTVEEIVEASHILTETAENYKAGDDSRYVGVVAKQWQEIINSTEPNWLKRDKLNHLLEIAKDYINFPMVED